MIKKSIKLIQLTICMAFFTIMLVSPLQAADKVINLKFSSFLGPGHPASKVLKEFTEELSAVSDGKVAIKYYGSSALGKANEQYDMVTEGMADIALTCCGLQSSLFPLSLGVQLPFFSDSAKTGAKVLMGLKERGFFDNEFEDVVYPFPTTTTPGQVFSNKKITTIEDFKGLRIWGGDEVFRDICDVVGATPVIVSTPEVYLLLQRGTLDAASNSWTSAVAGYKWHEVTKYALNISLMSGWHCNISMNKKAWNKIPKDIQTKWKELFPKYTAKIAAVFDGVDSAMQGKLSKVPGYEITEFSEADRKKLAEMLIPVWQKWVDKNGKQGEEFYTAYVEIMKEIGEPVMVKLPGLYKD